MAEIASRAQLRMSYLRVALVTVPLILMLGTLSGVLSGSGYDNSWFLALVKPAFMPPGWAFPVAWTTIYVLLGFALALILHARGARGRPLAIGLFAAQIILNYSWSPIFFAWHKIGLAFWVIAAMLVLAAITAWLFFGIRKAAGLMMLPHLAWLVFAASLNQQIGMLNPHAEVAPAAAGTDIPL